MHYSKPIKQKNEKTIKKKVKHQYVLKLFLIIFTLMCILPVILVFIASFTGEASITAKGFSYLPDEWSIEAWRYVATFKDQLIDSYLVSIFETVFGTLLTLILTSMFGYVLTKKDFCLRNALTIFLVVTMFVNSGPLAGYVINANVYHLRNNLLVLIIPGCVSVFNVVMMRTFVQSNIPDSLMESAKIDGAGDFYTYVRIVVPLMLPVFAAIGFMTAVGHWNEWQTSLMYIDNPKFATLQLMLMKIEKNISFLQENQAKLSAEQMEQWQNIPNQSCRMALLLCTILPTMVAYPFFQKYFIKGMTVGSVKG